MCFFTMKLLTWSFTKLSSYGNYWDELVRDYACAIATKGKRWWQQKENHNDDDGKKKTMTIITPCKLGQKTHTHETMLVDI